MTYPEATVLLLCMVTVPTVRPAAVMAVVAAACVSPARVGTDTCWVTGVNDLIACV
jgi:hypothetical protein